MLISYGKQPVISYKSIENCRSLQNNDGMKSGAGVLSRRLILKGVKLFLTGKISLGLLILALFVPHDGRKI